MQERQKLAVRVLCEGISVAQAAREAGVSRVTAHEWLGRARREGIAGMQATASTTTGVLFTDWHEQMGHTK